MAPGGPARRRGAARTSGRGDRACGWAHVSANPRGNSVPVATLVLRCRSSCRLVGDDFIFPKKCGGQRPGGGPSVDPTEGTTSLCRPLRTPAMYSPGAPPFGVVMCGKAVAPCSAILFTRHEVPTPSQEVSAAPTLCDSPRAPSFRIGHSSKALLPRSVADRPARWRRAVLSPQRSQVLAVSAGSCCSTSSPSIVTWISSLTTNLPSSIMLKLSPKSFLLILVLAL